MQCRAKMAPGILQPSCCRGADRTISEGSRADPVHQLRSNGKLRTRSACSERLPTPQEEEVTRMTPTWPAGARPRPAPGKKTRRWTNPYASLASARQRRRSRRLYCRTLRAWVALHSTIFGEVSQLDARQPGQTTSAAALMEASSASEERCPGRLLPSGQNMRLDLNRPQAAPVRPAETAAAKREQRRHCPTLCYGKIGACASHRQRSLPAVTLPGCMSV